MTSKPADRLAALRAELKRLALDGLLVPLTDAYLGEYVPACDQRLRWLTGFTGSAGFLLVTDAAADLFVDGRYTIQVRAETEAALFRIRDVTEESPQAVLKAIAAAGWAVGFDPWLHTTAEVERFRAAAEAAGARLVPVSPNPVDAVWADRPQPPATAVHLRPAALAGEETGPRIARIATLVGEAGADAAAITQSDSIAWLFNIRADDLPHVPVALARAILPATGRPTLFLDRARLAPADAAALEADADLADPAGFEAALSAAAAGRRILVDRNASPARVADLVTAAGGTVVAARDPVTLPKARKNAVEIAGTREAHLRDGAAMVRFLSWLDREAPAGGLDELSAAAELLRLRQETGCLLDLSFTTISAAGPNAALPHYHPGPQSNRPIRRDEIYLIDSGGQYADGTTDVTRTVIVGTPSEEMRDRFTRVLKGWIAISRARFPKGTTGGHLDALARAALWEAGLDFNHGTGHGVGAYLSVHEGPQRLSKTSDVPLEPGMILSNEPGYYREGAFGIRIETLLVVTEPEDVAGGDRPMMGFETVTFVPVDRRLIDTRLLTRAELAWFDGYHAAVRDKLLPRLADPADRAFLEQATAPLA